MRRLGLYVGFLVTLTALSSQSATNTAGGTGDLEPLIDLNLAYLSIELRIPWNGDPFRKVPGYAQVKPKEEKFVLGGIVYSEKEPMAEVNGESVLVGDEIDGRIVESIGRNYVVLKKGDSLKELVLPPAEPDDEDGDE